MTGLIYAVPGTAPPQKRIRHLTSLECILSLKMSAKHENSGLYTLRGAFTQIFNFEFILCVMILIILKVIK